MTTADVEIAVIGAGVVGLAIAKSLCERGHNVMVLERHGLIGSETSSRNSEVIHAGLYYPQGSLKAKFCIEGKQRLYRFAQETGVPHERCGKLLVATADDEIPALHKLAANAAACGVDDIKMLSPDEANALEPAVTCVAGALSPSTGIVDSHALMVALEGHILTHSGEVVLNANVTAARFDHNSGLFELTITSGNDETTRTASRLVIASGLGATAIADTLFATGRSTYAPPRTYYGKGHYFTLSGKHPFKRLVYPMPSAGWLGLHLTIDIAGQVKFGPDLDWRDHLDYTFEEEGGDRRQRFETTIRRYWPGLPDNALHNGYVGMRPKIYAEGKPPADFAIHVEKDHGMPGLVALYGIESPGLTSSLAIGEHVADLISAA